VVLTIRVAHIVLHVTLVELSIGEENLDLTVSHFPVFETAFNQFVARSEKPSKSVRSVFFPGTTVDAAVRELAETSSFTLVSLEVTLVDLAIGEDHFTLAIISAFADTSLVDFVPYIFEFIFSLL
jgi:hypothetical protein